MKKTGVFYGSTTGTTESVARTIAEKLGIPSSDVYNVKQNGKNHFSFYHQISHPSSDSPVLPGIFSRWQTRFAKVAAMHNIINLRLDITHLYYPAKNSFQKGRLKRREIFTELLLYTLTT